MLHKTPTNIFLLISLVLFFIQSCLDFGEDFETREPTAEQIAACKNLAWILPESKLEVQGIKWLGSGIDTAFWMTFSLEKEDRDNLFHPDGASWNALTQKNPVISEGPDWWVPEGSFISGGQVILPNGGTLEVFWQERGSRIRVSLFYFETCSNNY